MDGRVGRERRRYGRVGRLGVPHTSVPTLPPIVGKKACNGWELGNLTVNCEI